MKSLALLFVITLAACGDNVGENAPTLWLALDGRETEVKLVDAEPEPF